MATVCFDLDDTLYCEMDFVRSGYRAVASLLAADSGAADADSYFQIIFSRRPRGFEAAADVLYPMLNDGRRCPYTIDDLIEHYRGHTPQISLSAGVAGTLCGLAAAGHRLMLVTDGSTRHQRSKIRALGLERFFAPADILISEETGGDKTTAVPWSAVERLCGRNGRRWYVGDNMSKDFRLPNMRGWDTVMLLDTRRQNVFAQQPLQWPPQNRPRHTIVSPESLLHLIR